MVGGCNYRNLIYNMPITTFQSYCCLRCNRIFSYRETLAGEGDNYSITNAAGHFRGLWIGLKRGKDDDVFRWADGRAVSYTNWDVNEPKLSSRSKFCVTHSPGNSRWSLDYCGVRRWFVCRAPEVSIPHVPDTRMKSLTPCQFEDGSGWRSWWLYEGRCFLIHDDNKYTWETARTFCQDNGAQLSSLHSFEETDFLLSSMSRGSDSDLWIGLRSKGLRSSFSWADGTPLDFIYWSESDLEDKELINLMDTCVTFDKSDGGWRKDNCNRLLGIICERGVNSSYEFTSPAPTPSLPGFCSSGWYTLGNKCYKPFGHNGQDVQTWLDANISCQNIGGALVSVHSQSEQDFLTDLLLDLSADAWIGLTSVDRNTLYEWVDKSIVDYTNWDAGEPESDYEVLTDNCVEMTYNENAMAKWNDIPCTRRNAYICEKRKDLMLPDPGEDPFGCNNSTDGWMKLGSMCFGFYVQPEYEKSWLKAQSYCRTHGSNLMSMKNSGVGVFLRRKLTRKDQFFWTGIREIGDNKYRLLTGYPLVYTNWLIGQPSRVSDSRENCVAINADSKWVVRNCEERHPFICELGPEPYAKTFNYRNFVCPNTSDWLDLDGDSCYLFNLDDRLKWNSAMSHCFHHGGFLASFHSAAEINAVLDYARERGSHSVSIGLGRLRDGSFGWVDNSPLDFTNWDVDEPDHPQYNCVQMRLTSGKWNDIDCIASDAEGFICSVPKIATTGDLKALAVNLTKESTDRQFATGGIVGIVLCLLVIVTLAAVTAYYLCPSTRMRPKLLEPDSP